MDYTIKMNNNNVTVYAGGDPNKGTMPALTVTKIKNPQIVIDSDKGTIIILES